jgi:hypothetical protein
MERDKPNKSESIGQSLPQLPSAKFVLPIPIFFLSYLVPLDVDVTGNITAKIYEVWNEFSIFCIDET